MSSWKERTAGVAALNDKSEEVRVRKPIIAGNWKMHKTVSEAVELCEALDRSVQDLDIEVVVCPPFTALSAVCALNMGKVKIGAQNVSIADAGAYTGEISPLMLVDTCCSYVIIGHSERRQTLGKQTPKTKRYIWH